MFIYNFMSGCIETFTGGEDDANYDPHKYRKVQNPTTYAETMTHLLKGALGAGILAMPNAIARMGLAAGTFGVLFIGVFATYCVQLLIVAQYQFCKKWKRGYMSYPKTLRRALQAGPRCLRWTALPFAYSVDALLIIYQKGICAIFAVIIAESIKQITDYYGYEVQLRIIIACLYPPLVLLCLVKNLKLLAPLSTFANVCTLFGLILIFFYLVEDDVECNTSHFEVKSFGDVPVFIGIVLFGLEAIGVVLALEYNMEKPKQFIGICGLFSIGMASLTILYLVVGFFGYLKYGHEVKGAITLSLPQGEKKAQVAKLLLAAALFSSYPLQNYVAWDILWRHLRKRAKNNPKKVDMMLRVVVATIPFGLALLAPSLGAFIGLIGALCMGLVAIIYPAFLDMCAFYPDRYGFCHYKWFVDIIIIILGTFACFSGIYSSVIEIIQNFDNEN